MPGLSGTKYTEYNFRLFGKAFGLSSDAVLAEAFLRAILPLNAERTEDRDTLGTFRVVTGEQGGVAGLYWGDELINELQEYHLRNPELLDCKIQYSIALTLAKEWTFLHAGAVSYRGKGIIFPGGSKHGKTSLTRAFLEAGAEYLTDDCTVIGPDGSVHPYATPLKIRTSEDDDSRVLRYPSDFGSRISDPVPVSCIVFCRYFEGAVWCPSEVSQGETVWKLLEQLYYVPVIREHPGIVIRHLSGISESSIRLSGTRGEARVVVDDILRKVSES